MEDATAQVAPRAMPCGAGRRANAFMMNVEKARRRPHRTAAEGGAERQDA